MAKKTKSFSHIKAQDALEVFSKTNPTGEELVYSLLRIFCDYGDGSIRRIREGVGNRAKDGRTVLISQVIAYRPKGELDFFDEIKQMQADVKIVKQMPRLYVVSDGKTIVAVDPKEQDVYENEVALMWKDFDFFYPLAGIEKIRNVEEADADVKSAELMAKIYDEIRRYNDVKDMTEVHNLNIFMQRLLFCFFAEDTNLFPGENLFTNSIKQHTDEDGSDLAEFIDLAFWAMSTDVSAMRDTLSKEFAVFPYVNGGLFAQRVPIPVLSRRTRMLIIKCGDFNWKGIHPDIFGSMIQAVVTPEMRAGLGMHYTSVPNIMKLIRPLFLDELYEEFAVAKDTRDIKRLRKLLMRLGKIKFFDPACGSGNFLIVTYKCIRELEILIWQTLRELGEPELPMSNISLQQFYGIELDEFACDTATLSLWLVEHQMNNKFESAFGIRPNALPLRPSGNIVCGNACRLDWNEVCPHTATEEVYVMGNPPYLGRSLREDSHQRDMDFVFENIFDKYKDLDYIACWFYKGAKYIEHTQSLCSFVTTNSICQGIQVSLLWSHLLSVISIYFAYSSFKWGNNAKNNAGVTCTIIGIKPTNRDKNKYIFMWGSSIEVQNISPYIIASNTNIVYPTNEPINNLPLMTLGNAPKDDGAFILTVEEKETFETQYPEISFFVKPFVGAEEFINDKQRYCFWITDESFAIALKNEELHRRIEKCKIMRLNSKKEATRKLAAFPYKFGEIRYKESECIIIPAVSSERREYIPIGYMKAGVIVSNSAFAVYDAPLWLFSILTSKMHMVWVKTVGGKLETRYRYSTQLCYNTYPFPSIDCVKKRELEMLAQKLLDIRDQHFDMTLGEMYNPESMPEDLREAHQRLDLAVDSCYCPEPFASDEERLECLFKLYTKMNKK
ncbi:DNA methyltransferase [uncultured Bacteroides sp.]|uniref:DNA methyltransferase n=1 Tax=uncultured Bacteroides sp. TaxID=162156 RepID=UPI00259BAEAD|nr:DNA methyltransferase [uncultured Bacteroides sp.]